MFRLSKEADHWAKGIFRQEPFMIKFDYYYLFLLAGLLAKKSEAIKGEDAQLLDEFPLEYKKDQRLIINFLLIAHKKALGIPDSEKERLRSELVEKFIDFNNNTFSLAGRNLCNSYANRGFQLLHDVMAPPTKASDFLVAYAIEIKKLEEKF